MHLQNRLQDPPHKYISYDRSSKRYSDKDLAEFKTLIQDKITSAKKDLKRLRDSITQGAGNGTNDTYSAFKAFEEGSETLSKESNSILAQHKKNLSAT